MRAEDLKPNITVHGPLFPEPVQVIVVVPMDASVKLVGKGNSIQFGIRTDPDCGTATAPPAQEPFDGKARKSRLGIEAMRLGFAYEYDPYFSLSIARVDRLPQAKERRLVPEVIEDFFLSARPLTGMLPKPVKAESHTYRLDAFSASIRDGRGNVLSKRLFVVQTGMDGKTAIKQPTISLDLTAALMIPCVFHRGRGTGTHGRDRPELQRVQHGPTPRQRLLALCRLPLRYAESFPQHSSQSGDARPATHRQGRTLPVECEINLEASGTA